MKEKNNRWDCYKEITNIQKIHIFPKDFSDIKSAIEKYLSSLLLHWNKELSGAPISYSSIQIMNDTAKIMNDNPCIIIPVRVIWRIIQPEPGLKITCKIVTSINPELITCHYLEYFNVNIFANEMNQNYRWKGGNWYSIETEKPLEKDQEITVEILDVNINPENLNIIASLDRAVHSSKTKEIKQNKNEKKIKEIKRNSFFISNDEGHEDDHQSHSHHSETGIKKKKKHKSK